MDTPLESHLRLLESKRATSTSLFPIWTKNHFRSGRSAFQGTVEGMTLVNDELVIQSSLYIITGNGKIDLEHQQIDAKGLVPCGCRGMGSSDVYPSSALFSTPRSILGIPVRVIGPLKIPYYVSVPGRRRSRAFEHSDDGYSAYHLRRYGFLLQICGSRKGDDAEKLRTLAPRGAKKNCSRTRRLRTMTRFVLNKVPINFGIGPKSNRQARYVRCMVSSKFVTSRRKSHV